MAQSGCLKEAAPGRTAGEEERSHVHQVSAQKTPQEGTGPGDQRGFVLSDSHSHDVNKPGSSWSGRTLQPDGRPAGALILPLKERQEKLPQDGSHGFITIRIKPLVLDKVKTVGVLGEGKE